MKLKEFCDYANHFKAFDPHCPDHGEILELMLKRFNQLSDNDKLAVLLNVNDPDQKHCVVNESINAEVADIERENSIEMVHLRMWVIKTAIILVIVVSLGSVLLSVISGRMSGPGLFNDTVNSAVDLYNLLFK